MAEPHGGVDPLGDMRIFTSPFIRDGSMLVISGYPDLAPFRCQEVPQEVEDIAVDIVHTGLADVVAWLRESGHVILTWQERRDRRAWRAQSLSFAYTERLSLSVLPPTSVVKITSI